VLFSNLYLSATKPAPVQQQQPQTPPKESQDSNGGRDSAADIEARKRAFIAGMDQMFEDHGYGAGGSDHAMTDEEFEAMKKALGW
jgi:hypothetical protein